jgi:hypothetical protein
MGVCALPNHECFIIMHFNLYVDFLLEETERLFEAGKASLVVKK